MTQGVVPFKYENVWCYEHSVILHTEFRDGNVPAGYRQLSFFKNVLAG